MNTNDNTYLTINRLLDTLLSDLKATEGKRVEDQNQEYRSRLINTINDLNKLKAYY